MVNNYSVEISVSITSNALHFILISVDVKVIHFYMSQQKSNQRKKQYIILYDTEEQKPVTIRISGVTVGGQSASQRLLTGKFLLTYWEKESRKKGKRGENFEEKKENCKREGGKLEMEVIKVTKSGEDLFFFFFLFTFENEGNLFFVHF